jgi:hypothetical protein
MPVCWFGLALINSRKKRNEMEIVRQKILAAGR